MSTIHGMHTQTRMPHGPVPSLVSMSIQQQTQPQPQHQQQHASATNWRVRPAAVTPQQQLQQPQPQQLQQQPVQIMRRPPVGPDTQLLGTLQASVADVSPRLPSPVLLLPVGSAVPEGMWARSGTDGSSSSTMSPLLTPARVLQSSPPPPADDGRTTQGLSLSQPPPPPPPIGATITPTSPAGVVRYCMMPARADGTPDWTMIGLQMPYEARQHMWANTTPTPRPLLRHGMLAAEALAVLTKLARLPHAIVGVAITEDRRVFVEVPIAGGVLTDCVAKCPTKAAVCATKFYWASPH